MSEHHIDFLYRRYRPEIYARCRRLLVDRASAEDATQEVFVRVATNIDAVPASFEALLWLHRVATNYCLTELRNRKRWSVQSTVSDEDRADRGEDRIADVDLVRRLIARAPERIRAAVWLYHAGGMSHEEVGRALRLSRRTIINYLQDFQERALTFLRRQP